MWKTIISAIVCVGFIWLLDTPLHIGKNSLPAIGRFFSPSHGFWQNAEGEVETRINISIDGLTKDVRVVLDDRLVPHIFAGNRHDLYYAQGYITAMHRLWQMDFSTRAAAGRISEVVGPRALNFDQNQRRTGLAFAANNAIKGWKKFPEEYQMLEAYSDGVNAFIKDLSPRDYPLEFKLMNFHPEAWSTYKTALFTKSMAARLCLQEFDLEYSTLLKWLGKSKFEALFPEYNPIQDPIIPPGTVWDFDPVIIPTGADTLEMEPTIGTRLTPDDDIQLGSNNWAVAGSKTASGFPILCNDPHLGLSLPSVWYEVHLNTPDHNCYGVSLPGVPGVIIGFNDQIAWGMTNVGHDMLDWYRIEWTDNKKTHYILDGETVAAELQKEVYHIAGQPDVIDTIRYTIWGPVREEGAYRGLAMRWLPHDESDKPEMAVFMDLNRASNVEEYLIALDKYQAPAQNFAYADQEGNIALRIGGKLPLRSVGHGKFVQDGSKSSNAWYGYIPPRHNPVVINPERGFISSANQRTTDSDYPYYYLGGRYFEDYRGRILNEKLNAMNDITVEDMQALQANVESLKARDLLPHLLKAVTDMSMDTEQETVFNALKSWDYRYTASSKAAIYWQEWYSAFYDLVWDEFDVLPDSVMIVRPESWRTIELATMEPNSDVFDLQKTPAVEDFQEIARLSFQRATDSIRTFDTPGLSWGAYRKTTIRHLANLDPMNVILDDAPGNGDALNATGTDHGPSWRMVVHLTDPIEAWVVYPGGQSGNPGSPYYDDMIRDWVKGQYHKVQFAHNPDEIEAQVSMHLQTRN